MKRVEQMRVKDVEKVVKRVLTERPETRGDDFLLLLLVYSEYYAQIPYELFGNVMVHHKEIGLPPFESVRRARQKIQAECEELKAPERVRKARAEKEVEYREYARE